jgi:hypothetical protein
MQSPIFIANRARYVCKKNSKAFTLISKLILIFAYLKQNTLGWKYEQAFESSQKYKEGKYIIELIHLIKDNGWDTLTTNSWDTTNNATSQSKSDYYRSFNSFNFFKFACKKFLDRGTSSPSSSSSCATQKSNTNSTSSLNASSSKKLLLSITN